MKSLFLSQLSTSGWHSLSCQQKCYSSVVLFLPLRSWFCPLSSSFCHLCLLSFFGKGAHVFKSGLSAYICQHNSGDSTYFIYFGTLSILFSTRWQMTVFLMTKLHQNFFGCVWIDLGVTPLEKRHFHRYFWDTFFIFGFYHHSHLIIILNFFESLRFYWD